MMSLEKHYRRLLEEIEQERKKCLELQKQVVDLKVAQEDKEVHQLTPKWAKSLKNITNIHLIIFIIIIFSFGLKKKTI